MTEPLSKACENCGAEFFKRPRNSRAEWAARKVCSRSCRPSIEVRLWAKVDVRGPDDCWIWSGSVTSTGHGNIRWKGQSRGVHAVLWELAHGRPAAGFEVHHRCETKTCCNIAHMQLLTKAEHSRISDGGAYQRVKTHCPQGHPYSGENLYVTPIGGRSCRICLRAAQARKRQRARDQRISAAPR